jgi:nucleotide-binding universal stress UspA family protein
VARRTIIIGYNDSPQGEDALALGRVLGEALDATAAVAIVVQYPRRAAKKREAEAFLTEFSEPLFAAARERLGDIEVIERLIVDESPGRALDALAGELNSNLTVIGSAHHGPVGQVILGGVGESMLSGAPSGIAVAPLGYAGGERGLGRIGAAVDGSAQSFRALEAAIILAERAEASIRVLTVVPPHHYVLGGALSPLGPEEYDRFKRDEAEAVLDKAIERVPNGLPAERDLLDGAPAEALADAAEQLDLLMVGSRGYGPLKGALLGSVSSKLMKSTPCAVLVLPRGSGTDPLGE